MLKTLFGSNPPSFRVASELQATKFQHFVTRGVRERRGLISIGVIDDEPFQPKHNLENVGYKVHLLGDPNNIEVVRIHQIILCDIQGVGQALDTRKQGAFLIREIKTNYPDKYVVAYSGGAMNQSVIRDSVSAADAFMKKDVDIETWTEKLDDIIQNLLDPYRFWMRQRKSLVDRNIDTLTILKIEDAFVRSLDGHVGTENTPLASYAKDGVLSADVRGVVQSLVASAIFKIFVG